MENITSIKIFGFMANWSPFFLAFVILVTAVFYLVTTRWYDEFEGGRPLTRKEGSCLPYDTTVFPMADRSIF